MPVACGTLKKVISLVMEKFRSCLRVCDGYSDVAPASGKIIAAIMRIKDIKLRFMLMPW
jgi:hypothetical protein